MSNTYPHEKLLEARRFLMLPHPNGEEESIKLAIRECSFALKNLDKDTLDESQSELVAMLEGLMDTDALSEAEKSYLSKVVDELATSFCRDFFEK